MSIGTGLGATITFGTTSFSGAITSIGESERSIDDIEDHVLATTGSKTFIPGDLAEEGEVTIPFYVNSKTAYPVLGTVETITITYRQQADEATSPATEIGTGYIKRLKKAQHVSGELMAGEITFKWDGKTPPAFTAAV